MNKINFDPMKRKEYRHGTAMKQALDRTKELYPNDPNLALSGAIGNEKQYPKEMEWK